METDHTDIKVNLALVTTLHVTESNYQVIVPLREIEFLNFDDVSSDQERSFLYNCVKAHHGNVDTSVVRHQANYLCRGSTARVVQEAVADSQERAVLQPCRPPGGRAPVLTGGHAVLNGDAGEGSEPV